MIKKPHPVAEMKSLERICPFNIPLVLGRDNAKPQQKSFSLGIIWNPLLRIQKLISHLHLRKPDGRYFHYDCAVNCSLQASLVIDCNAHQYIVSVRMSPNSEKKTKQKQPKLSHGVLVVQTLLKCIKIFNRHFQKTAGILFSWNAIQCRIVHCMYGIVYKELLYQDY